MPPFTHDRDDSRSFRELRFAAAEVLDTAELARRWAAWIDLSDTDPAPIRSRHATYLAGMLTGEYELVAPSWFATISVTSSRFQVVAQARAAEYHCEGPADLPDRLRTPRWRALVRSLEHFPGLPIGDQVVVVMLLTQLGFHRQVVRVLGRVCVDGDPLRQQLAYEGCRAAYQLNRRSPLPAEIFGWLAENAARPALRTLAALQLVSARSRDDRDRSAAGRWLTTARTACSDLGGEPRWLVHLVSSRYHRAAALHEVAGRDHERVIDHLRAALRHDEHLARLAAGPFQTHYQRENRGLVLEAYLKYDALTGLDGAPLGAADELRMLDPVDPEPLYTIGQYHASRDRWEAAGEVMRSAAAGGTLRGAMAAGAAAVCARRLGRTEEAARARRLCRELDPAALPVAPPEPEKVRG